MRVSIRTAALGCAFALCALVFTWISGQTGALRFVGTMQWLIGHTEGYMLLAFGMGIFLVVISAQWNAIANHFRIRHISLADVEVRHPRLPRYFEISQTAALTFSFVILLTQFAAIVYAMAYVLANTSAEVKYTRGFIAIDIDNDGDLDYIGVNNNGSIGEQNIDVYRNPGTASFGTHWTFGTSLGAIGGLAGDVDLDGDVDVVVFRNNGSANMTVYKNDGTGMTWVPTGIAAATGILDAVLTDVDSDGDLDLVAVKIADTTSAVYINDGTGTFTSAASTLPAGVAIAAADFNSDGAMDIVTINSSGNGIYVYANSGTGAFTSISVTAIGQVVESMEVGDMDGNGTIDIVTFDGGNEEFHVMITNSIGQVVTSTGPFGSVANLFSGAVGDVDNDGDLDVEIAASDPAAVNGGNELWLNDGSASFTQSGTPTEQGDCTHGITFLDADNDGDLDYLAGNDDGTCNGAGGNSRIYTSDQSLSLANAAPSAPSSLLSTISASHSTGSLAPRIPLMATDVAGVGTMPWLHPENIYTLNGISSSGGMLDMTNHTTHWLKATDFGFNIASGSTIVGIVASWNKNYGGCGMWDNGVRIVKRGTIGATDKSNPGLWPSGTFIDYGGSTDLWGETWTTSDINASNFGAVLSATQFPCGVGNSTPSIDNVKITVYYYNAVDILMQWGSGSDLITPARQLQYQVRVATASNGHDVISGKVASPNYVDRMMPNGQSRRRIMKAIGCNQTFFWGVKTVDSGLRMSAESAEQTFTIGTDCTLSGGGGGTTGGTTGGSAGGGGGVGYWQLQGQQEQAQAVPSGTIAGQLFLDVNGNGKKEKGERGGFAGVRVEATGKDQEGTDVTQAVVADLAGAFRMTLPAGTYALSAVDSSGVLHGYVATTDTLDVTVGGGETVTADFGWKNEKLLGYKPCLSIGEVNLETGKPVSQALLLGIKNLYGQTLAHEGTLSEPLVSRKEFMELLAGTQCLSLTKSGDALREDLRAAAKKNGWLSGVLSDVPVPENLVGGTAWGTSAYALLAQGVPAGRAVGETLVADGNAPVTKREAMAMVAAMLGVQTDGQLVLSLPPDATADDATSGTFVALKKAGVLPRGFEVSIGGGVIPSEAAELLVKAAFAGGKLTLSALPDEVRWDQNAVPDYLELAGTIDRRDCLTQDSARAVSIRSDILPNAAGDLFERLQLLLSVGTNDAEDRTRWLITGRPSEYGVKAGTIGLSPNKAVTWVGLADIGMKLTCHPLETFQEASRRLSGGGMDLGNGGTANMIFAPDRIFGTEDGVTYVQRLLHSFQRPIREFNLTPLAFAQDLTLEAQKDFSAPVSQTDASRLLASYVLYTRVKTGAMTRLEAEGSFAELQTSILKKLTGIGDEDLWRMASAGDNAALTWGQLITVVSDVLGPELHDTPLPGISTGEAWWNVIGR